jgi:putative CocE/NonD family hydrolase
MKRHLDFLNGPRRVAKWIHRGKAPLLAVLLSVSVSSTWAKLPGEKRTPAGKRRSTSQYVKMRDGVEIAVSVWLPSDLQPGERVPVLMKTARYWREPQYNWPLRILAALHLVPQRVFLDRQVSYYNSRHFAVVLADARGSGASGGRRAMEYSPTEVADMGEVAAWAVEQPWSNGRVGTFGISYEGNTAELAAVSNQPAIKAAMPQFDAFDDWENIGSGGVMEESFQGYGDLLTALDHNDVCGADEATGLKCWRDKLFVRGVRPVDADPHGRHLAELIEQHQNRSVVDEIAAFEFRDDRVTTEEGSFSLGDISPYGLRTRIEASKVPMMIWCGWLDGIGAEEDLIRYKTLSNPQLLIIGPLSHGGDYNIDPFGEKHSPPEPPLEEQYKMQADFFDRVLRSDPPGKIESSIHYYTMGEGEWHTTKTWPPAGVSVERLYFSEHQTLELPAPTATTATDSYTVDFTTTTGKRTRWDTGIGGGDVVYPNRAEADTKLLVYTSAPLEADTEITGTPILTVEMASTNADGALHAYLEDVSPEGGVTYIDEGMLRLIHRREVDPTTLPYVPLGPAHSFLRKDAEPLVPGKPATIRFSLFATSIVLKKGHRIRVAIAGADAGRFRRYPSDGTPTWTVYRELQRPSFIELPIRKPESPAHRRQRS